MVMVLRLILMGITFSTIGLRAQLIEEVTLMHDGLERTYIIYVPAIYDENTAVPLVINIHGLGSNANEQMVYGNFTAIADTANFIVVHPNGTEDGQGQTFWNSFSSLGVDDVGFISAMIDHVSSQYNIDENCIYSTGMSNGGFMSYYLACNLSERIAAIASVTGSMVIGLPESCNAQHPTPVMEIHGTSDGVVPYNGSIISEPINDVVDFWVSYNNCNPVAEFSEVPNIVSSDNCTAEHYVFTDGILGSSVELYKVIDGDHSWPGAIININVTNMDFSASTEIWRFFRKYKLNMLISVADPILSESIFSIYPNPGNGKYVVSMNKGTSYDMECYDSTGRLIHFSNGNSTSLEFSLPEPGLYIISLSDSAHTERLRVVYE
jgi:polyhydroxybutyrate depolymerase